MKTFEITLDDDTFERFVAQVKKIRLIDDYPITFDEFIDDSIRCSCDLLEIQRGSHSNVSAYAEKGVCNIYE